MTYLIAIDDTDEADSRGTGYRARQLGRLLRWLGMARIEGITRHQLSRNEAIHPTSQNSAACLRLTLQQENGHRLRQCARTFLRELASLRSEPGLCIASTDFVGEATETFGQNCKREVVSLEQAVEVARQGGLELDFLWGEGRGRIGALAAIGLSASGEDGRFIWLRGLRRLSGIHRLQELRSRVGIAGARTREGQPAREGDRIRLGAWVRPLLRGGVPVLLVEPASGDDDCEWKLLDKRVVKKIDG